MGLIEYLAKRRQNRLMGDLQMLEKRFQFNAYQVYMPSPLLATDKINKSLVESLVWYSKDVEALQDLYQKNQNRYPAMQGGFWNLAPSHYRKVHSGLPNLIVSKMPTIIFGSGYDVNLKVYQDGQESEEKTIKANELYEILRERLELTNKYMAASEQASWSGHTAAKFSIDETLTPLPILEFFDRRYFDIVKVRGITQAIIFKTYYEIGSGENAKQFILKETYTTNNEGKAVILNNLFIYNLAKGEEMEVALTSIPQTAELMPEITFAIDGMLAYEMPNIVPKKLIKENPYGQSDITAFTIYDALDEVMSQLVNEIRDNKTIRYIPDDMLPKDSEGEFKRMNAFVTNYIKYKSDKDQNANNEITTTQIADKTMEHYEKYKVLITNACNQSELSPLSLGITGLDSIASSQESTREKAKATVEMRDKKVQLWKNFLKRVVTQMMLVYDYMAKEKEVIRGYGALGINYNDIDVEVNFNDYMGSSTAERIAMWSQAKQTGVASIDMVVKKIHTDLSDEDQQEEINRLRFEAGISIDTPETLRLDEVLNEGE